ncbi:polysaccharide biosynthesis tyrosine autokinase [Ligilactobacillus ceti]|uniref:Tyrosine-protein kinase CpsD n=1 Tax=Ligilactobacillus ceti DSM 22408 TaxID=1122146 RepID=A0A0R2KG86_9LACO|nr:polysaccharide biosynthesis tyrosine autokinase [Ligilactobacillus ceti]KRN88385.1 non-specific protein-tyrosine kinase [Ligilactobacillus ceti DSM 22408]
MHKVDILKNTQVINPATEEYYNKIRTNIQFSCVDVKTILVTSHTQSEGKSTVSLNIALSFAKLGLNVLYLDADVRKSALTSRFYFEDGALGLTNYLSGLSSLDDILYQSELPNLTIIPAGNYSPNPTELLESHKFQQLLASFKEQYDYIIIDAAPIGVVVDALILAKQSDASLLVAGSQMVKKNEVLRTVEQLNNTQSQFLGVILNKVNVKKNRSYGNYGNY